MKIFKQLKNNRRFLRFTVLRLVSSVVFFVVPLLLAKVLAPEGFGSYSLGMMIVYLFASLLVMSFKTPFIRYANEENKETGKINLSTSAAFVFLSVGTIVFLLGVWLFKDQLMSFAEITSAQLLPLVLAYVGLALRYFIGGVLLAANKRVENAVYEALVAIISVLYLSVIYFWFDLTLGYIFIMFFVAPVIATLLIAWQIPYKKLGPFKLEKVFVRKMLKFTQWVFLGTAAIYLVNWGDNFVLKYFVSLDDIGIYNLGYQPFKGIIAFMGFLPMYFLPFLSRNLEDKKKLRNYIYNKRPKIFFTGLAGIAVLFFLGPWLLNLYYGSEFAGSATVFGILALGLIPALYRKLYDPLFDALERYKFKQTLNVFFVTLNLLLDIWFVSMWGFVGAAIATAIAYAFIGISYEIYFQTRCKKDLLESTNDA